MGLSKRKSKFMSEMELRWTARNESSFTGLLPRKGTNSFISLKDTRPSQLTFLMTQEKLVCHHKMLVRGEIVGENEMPANDRSWMTFISNI